MCEMPSDSSHAAVPRQSMADFAVLGAPDPGLPSIYRGTSRDLPLVRDDLGLSHAANRLLLELLETDDVTGTDLSYPLARRLYEGYRGPGIGEFELVEVTRKGRDPEVGSHLLGFDVCFTEGGTESLLASILLYESPFGEPADAEVEARVAPLRERFRSRLNDHLLFGSEADATEFLDAAKATGPWEGPEIDWEVVGVWLVAEEAQTSAV